MVMVLAAGSRTDEVNVVMVLAAGSRTEEVNVVMVLAAATDEVNGSAETLKAPHQWFSCSQLQQME